MLTLASSRVLPLLFATIAGLSQPRVAGPPGPIASTAELRARLEAQRLEVELRGEPLEAFALLASRQADGPDRWRAPRPLAFGRLDAQGLARLWLDPPPSAVDALLLQAVQRGARGSRSSTLVQVGASVAAPGAQGAPARPQAAAGLVPFRIVACSLGCTGAPGQVIGCSQVNVFQNQELRLRFTLPVALSSVNAASFQLFDVGTGQTPSGSVSADPGDPSTLVFRPGLAFDVQGNPQFGFQAGATYQLRIPGANHDAGPFVRATTGADNLDRLQCSVVPSLGVMDYVPGAPGVSITVDVVTGYDPVTGLPNSFAQGVPASGAQNVWVDSDITFVFDDVMYAGTLFGFQSGQPTNVRVWIDQDGDPATTSDRVPQAGGFALQVDLASKSTRLVFDPAPAMPHSGGGPSPVLMVVETTSGVLDIVGNPLANAGAIAFQTER